MHSKTSCVVAWYDDDLTTEVQQCEACLVNQKSPAAAPLHLCEWPKKPWWRIHVHADNAGPFQEKTLFVVIDVYSKWIEAVTVSCTSNNKGTSNPVCYAWHS